MTHLLSSPSIERILSACKNEPSILLEGLWDAPKAAILSLLFSENQTNILLVTSDKSENKIVDNLDYFGINRPYEFPSWETLPGEEIAPSPDIVGRRFEILYHLLEKKGPKVVLCPLQALLQKLPSPEKLRPNCNLWKVGEEIPFDALDSFLEALGYRKERVVADKGEYALRRGILDIFPLSAPEPFRIEFFGDEIESIRLFDPVGQTSVRKVDELFLSPASEPKLLEEESELSTLLTYLGPNTTLIFDDLVALEDRAVTLRSLPGSRTRYFSTIDEILDLSKECHKLYWTNEPLETLSSVEGEKVGRDFYTGKAPLQEIAFEAFGLPLKSKRMLHPLQTIDGTPDEILLSLPRARGLHLLTATESEEATLRTKINELNVKLPKDVSFERGYLASGFSLSDASLTLLPMTELTGRLRVRRQKWRGSYHTPAAEFHELNPGDLVVHFHNGIGKYKGTEKKTNHLGKEDEFLVIEYAERSLVFVPIAQSYLVSRYIGASEELPTLSQIGTKKWERARLSAQKAILGYAEELLRQHAEREIHGGIVYPADSPDTLQFEDDFPFMETDDQQSAIAAFKSDMTTEKAMDRLVCGDVGYGKTEVAMRAAFKAVVDGGKQVAILVPTTVLAMQHHETFCARMANFPINIGVVSRFLPAKTVRENLEKAANGSLDILIGTHRIVSKDVAFNDLGLIIIDEEQKFGVRAKEHLKKLKAGVDCLTLSATPIPRTLYMSLVGARDVSVINTPPQDRLPIKSFIAERDKDTIQNALLRELSRDGQAFFIHNRVETTRNVAKELQELLPQARIVVGHGQMSADELDRVYHLFKSGEADILVATTIVENGVDIPNANTILIDRADTFGLADLYQIRGRVGRWNRPAYCYFLVPQKRELSEISRKRLHALIDASGHGGGMKIAMRDLEIRGAGDILGTKQSGQVSSIGFHLYCKLLKKTIDALKKKRTTTFIDTKLEFSIDARLPDDYINEPSLRMELYHRLGEATTHSDVENVRKEMADRFGPIPAEANWLLHLTRLRITGIERGYTLLKFEKFTFRIEKKVGKQVEKLVQPMPKETDPEAFEKAVTDLMP